MAWSGGDIGDELPRPRLGGAVAVGLGSERSLVWRVRRPSRALGLFLGEAALDQIASVHTQEADFPVRLVLRAVDGRRLALTVAGDARPLSGRITALAELARPGRGPADR
jgi:hypothetical protein